MDNNTLSELAQTLRQLAYELPQKSSFYVHKLADILEKMEVQNNDSNYWN